MSDRVKRILTECAWGAGLGVWTVLTLYIAWKTGAAA